MKKHLLTAVKVSLSLAIVAFLTWRAARDDAFGELAARFRDPGFDWGLLGLSLVACTAAVMVTLIRWWLLVRALHLRLSLRDAIRIGFLGYLLNLAPMGIVGGDLVKGVLLARQQDGRRTQSFATVIVDRLIGLYALFLVVTAAIFFTGLLQHHDPKVVYIAQASLWVTGGSTLGIVLLFIGGLTHGQRARHIAQKIPYIGRLLAQTMDSLGMYGRNIVVLTVSVAMSMAVHILFAFGLYFLTLGIYGHQHGDFSLAGEFVVSPLAAATQVIPIGVGPLEAALDYLYVAVFSLSPGEGFVIALGYRLISLLIALVGVGYYVGARAEISEVMREAETLDAPETAAAAAETDSPPPSTP